MCSADRIKRGFGVLLTADGRKHRVRPLHGFDQRSRVHHVALRHREQGMAQGEDGGVPHYRRHDDAPRQRPLHNRPPRAARCPKDYNLHAPSRIRICSPPTRLRKECTAHHEGTKGRSLRYLAREAREKLCNEYCTHTIDFLASVAYALLRSQHASMTSYPLPQLHQGFPLGTVRVAFVG